MDRDARDRVARSLQRAGEFTMANQPSRQCSLPMQLEGRASVKPSQSRNRVSRTAICVTTIPRRETTPAQSRLHAAPTKQENRTPRVEIRLHSLRGEGGIRTLGSLLSYARLASGYLRPLGHLSRCRCGAGRLPMGVQASSIHGVWLSGQGATGALCLRVVLLSGCVHGCPA